MAEPLRALTIRQPWCSAITFGGKRVENRTRPTRHRGLLALHAGLAVDWHVPEAAWFAAGLTPYLPGGRRSAWTASLPLGAVIAVANLTACHADTECEDQAAEEDRGELRYCSPWAMRWSWHWVLADVRPLPEQVPCRGALGLWRLPEDVETRVREQLEAADAVRD